MHTDGLRLHRSAERRCRSSCPRSANPVRDDAQVLQNIGERGGHALRIGVGQPQTTRNIEAAAPPTARRRDSVRRQTCRRAGRPAVRASARRTADILRRCRPAVRSPVRHRTEPHPVARARRPSRCSQRTRCSAPEAVRPADPRAARCSAARCIACGRRSPAGARAGQRRGRPAGWSSGSSSPDARARTAAPVESTDCGAPTPPWAVCWSSVRTMPPSPVVTCLFG